jgi:lysozyme
MILGIDASTHQDDSTTPQRIDWEKTKKAGARFAIIRACQNLDPDEDFDYNWGEAKRVGIPRGAYHFFDYRNGKAPAVMQAEYFWSLIEQDPGEIAPAMDFEKPNKYWPDLPTRVTCLDMIQIFLTKMDMLSKRKSIFYSNENTIRWTLAPIPSIITNHPLWIAAWPKVHVGQTAEDAAKGFVPFTGNWPTYTLWQFTTVLDGKKFGMESAGLDGDYFNGGEEAFKIFTGGGISQTQGEESLTLEERVIRLEQAAELAGWQL